MNKGGASEEERHQLAEATAALAEAHEAVARLLARHPELLDAARLRLTDVPAARVLPHPWRETSSTGEAAGRWAHIVRLDPDDAAAWIRAFGVDNLMNHESPFDLESALVRREITRVRRERHGRIHENTKAESRLAQLRLKQGLTQEEMVRRTGLKPMTYWRLERKRIENPPIGYLAACARALEVELDAVLEPEYLNWRP